MSTMDVSRVAWRKSSRSSGNGGACVEVGAWRKSSRSSGNGGQCVEVAEAPALRLARDSKNPTGPVLAFTVADWRRFTAAVKSGAFDL